MADFVMKSIITDKNKRFKTAQEMLDALNAIGLDGMQKDSSVISITHNGEDVGNPVDYINSLYSQSRHGNGGTRAGVAQHEFDTLTYSETRLDRELIADIEALKYKLIIITGNAGDGKTAFIHRIEVRAWISSNLTRTMVPNSISLAFDLSRIMMAHRMKTTRQMMMYWLSSFLHSMV